MLFIIYHENGNTDHVQSFNYQYKEHPVLRWLLGILKQSITMNRLAHNAQNIKSLSI